MDNTKKIREIITGGENSHVEFKREIPSKTRELSEEICSFANAKGGIIIIGVNDKNEIVGCSTDNKKRSAIQMSIGEISPRIACEQYSVEIDGKELWVIEVPEGKDKPYFLAGVMFKREGANSQKITDVEEIRETFSHNNKIFFDEAPMPRVNMMDILDMENFNEFRREAGMSADIPVAQILENMQIFNDEGQAKRGGVLFFAQNPETFFFHAVIRCVRFKGTDKIFIIDDKTFGGPLLQQYHKAMTWLQGTLTVSYEITGAGPRKEVWEIPLSVFKEALINALSHRDYFEKGASITIEVFDDRVEITNPGDLLPTVARNFGRRSMSRNPLIFGLFNKMRLVEHIGSGIPRMRKDMTEAGLPEPMFEDDGIFVVTLFRHTAKKETVPIATVPYTITDDSESFAVSENVENELQPITDTQREIMFAMIRNPQITLPEIAAKVGLGRTTVYKLVKQLQERELVARRGRKSDGCWVVID